MDIKDSSTSPKVEEPVKQPQLETPKEAVSDKESQDIVEAIGHPSSKKKAKKGGPGKKDKLKIFLGGLTGDTTESKVKLGHRLLTAR